MHLHLCNFVLFDSSLQLKNEIDCDLVFHKEIVGTMMAFVTPIC